jgi:LuxR family quorum sensing-dependent transcriptional regulator
VSIDSDAWQFTLRLQACETPQQCAALFRSAIEPYGFDTFACGEFDTTDRNRNAFYIIEWTDAWSRFYMASGFIERDPIVEEVSRRPDPFTWSDLRRDRKMAKAGTDAIAKASQAGWVEGLVVPIRRPGTRKGLVSLAGHRDCPEGDARAFLCLISLNLFAHVTTLVGRHGFAIAPAALTEREIASIRLVSRGMSDKAVGETLGVSATTAHEFVEKAKRRLGVRTRAELAALGVALGIADLGPVD